MVFVNFKKASLLFLFTVFQCALLVSARPQHAELVKRESVDARGLATNAKRMQAGLGPLKPRTLYNPSRVAARDPSPSAISPSGNIVVKRADGSEVGYVSTAGFGLLTTSGDNLDVSFNPNNVPFNIAISGSPYPYLGFVGNTLTTNALGMGATNPTPPGSPSELVGTEYGSSRSESAVWYYSAKDHQLTAQWVNPDNSVFFPSFVYVPDNNRIGLDMNPGTSEVFLYLA